MTGPVGTIERLSANDLLELASETRDAPRQAAAIVRLGGDLDLDDLRDLLRVRLPAVPRLRQRLVWLPPGLGRPVWVDDADFDLARHVVVCPCPAQGQEAGLLAVAADAVVATLPLDRALWSVTLVRGLADGGSALVLVVHHVLADGLAGLAALAALVDGVGPVTADSPVGFPAPPASRRELFRDAVRRRLSDLTGAPQQVRGLRMAAAELGLTGPGRPQRRRRVARSTFNRPIGPRRAIAVARADLARLSATAHDYDATINDLLLAAVGGALGATARSRGEAMDSVVISIPVSTRRTADVRRLGNHVGVIPVEVPCSGSAATRVRAVAVATATRRHAVGRGASVALLGPAFRLLARVGLLGWFIDHQRLVTTFVTNLHGPAQRLSLVGIPVTRITTVSPLAGNVTLAFAAVSYAGTLEVSVIADPERCPDLPALVGALQRELDELSGSPRRRVTEPGRPAARPGPAPGLPGRAGTAGTRRGAGGRRR